MRRSAFSRADVIIRAASEIEKKFYFRVISA